MTTPHDPQAADTTPLTQRKLSLLATVKAVAWSFFGVRRGADYQADVARLNPVHVAIAGIIGGACFIGALVLLVRWVVTMAAGT
jgi:Protein of unknown function (DUF2970)